MFSKKDQFQVGRVFGSHQKGLVSDSGCAKTGHHKANRLAYSSSHLFDAASIYGSGVEGSCRNCCATQQFARHSILTHRQSQRKSVMRKRQWSRSCSKIKRRQRKLCLDGLYFLYLFCAFLCPREMAGTTGLEPAASAVTAAP